MSRILAFRAPISDSSASIRGTGEVESLAFMFPLDISAGGELVVVISTGCSGDALTGLVHWADCGARNFASKSCHITSARRYDQPIQDWIRDVDSQHGAHRVALLVRFIWGPKLSISPAIEA